MTTAPSPLKSMTGDLIALAEAGSFDLIAHGCNCFCTMGAGIAKTITARFPAAWDADRATRSGDRAKLGTCSAATLSVSGRELIIVNAYTQFDFRGTGVKVDYDAIERCMQWIRATFPGRRIGLPMIGAGLGGADWPRIATILARSLAGEDVSVVQYVQQPQQPR